jgi:hypothetical protein
MCFKYIILNTPHKDEDDDDNNNNNNNTVILNTCPKFTRFLAEL